MVKGENKESDGIGGIGVAVIVSVLVILMVIGYMMFDINSARLDRITEQMFDEIEDADCSSDFYDGWVAAVNHFGVLWRSGENMTGVKN